MDDIEERRIKLELRLAQLEAIELRRKKFLPYVRHMWPDFIAGRHHEIIAEKFEAVAEGKLRRLIITMPPRHTKSEFASFLLPSWMMGRNPKMKIIQATHTAELAVGFGRKVKNLIETDEYAEIFPDTQLAIDSKAAGRWNTSKGGDYHALGVGGAMAGKGADLCHPFGTMVEANGKPTRIEDVQVGDRIATHYGRESVTARKLTTHSKSVIINSDLESSPDHRYLLVEKGWQQADGIQVGDKLLTTTIWRRAWHKSEALKRRLEELGKAWFAGATTRRTETRPE